MNNTTFYNCNWTFAEEFIGIKTEKQGLIMIGYGILQFILIIIFLFQNYQMISFSVHKKLRFLYISNWLFILYLASKLSYSLEDVAFCVDYTQLVWIEIVTFELFVIPINFFNLSVCESLLIYTPLFYYRAINKLKCIKLVTWSILFPIIGLQFTFYLIDMFSHGTMIFSYFDLFFRIIFFITTIIIFIECLILFRFLFNKNEKVKLITSKMKFFCFYIVLISAFLIRLIWTLIISIQRIINPFQNDWMQKLLIQCFDSGCLYALIIGATKMFITETVVLCAISFILYRDTNKTFQKTFPLTINENLKNKKKLGASKFKSFL